MRKFYGFTQALNMSPTEETFKNSERKVFDF